MSLLPQSIDNLINEFSSLPGIGNKSAERLAFYLLRASNDDLKKFSSAIAELKNKITFCSVCQNFSESNPCQICSDKQRNQDQICIVEEPLDMVAIEKTHEFHGLYHILHGAISPVDGIGPDSLKINELLARLKNGKMKEIILATNPSLEGEATAMYIAKLLKPFNLNITRIAKGIPTGGDLEYADEVTLINALKGRKEY